LSRCRYGRRIEEKDGSRKELLLPLQDKMRLAPKPPLSGLKTIPNSNPNFEVRHATKPFSDARDENNFHPTPGMIISHNLMSHHFKDIE
jgi:hypothetical protein